ncbi:hypothetical protein SDC9_184954 [bioreactor metagenome]|uniref:Uncharacterized protein n=1 Tax=bioreactor metagenome TaxID=1076179 RepID=A0A645HFU1_9ZZZZ
MDLHGLGRDLVARFGGVILRHRSRHARVGAVRVLELRGSVYELLRGLQLRRHIRDHEADALKIGDTAAKLLAFFSVFHGLVESALRDADARGAHTDASDVERFHGILEPHVFLAQQVVLVYAHVLKNDIGGRAADDAHFTFGLAAGDAWQLHIHDEGGNALRPLLPAVGLRVDDGPVRHRRARYK